ncbi:cyclic nucleotide-gated cation channel beta-3-like isoform X1 [Macrosteles quadrilineatus]|uniref:cyclic nucleotide-gated cation channel beta-3-like isoform X1 n=2 Tax=Macrosteles quadrilineatus TaxID=74068 RepID=UPI0023E184A8|nr:cyclic nucleotide-gated cation channel beta-3-like isoform X1 [Macrosteles quadrilineatus]
MDKITTRKNRQVHPQQWSSAEEDSGESSTPQQNHVSCFTIQDSNNMTQQCEDVKSVSVRSDIIQSDPSNTPDQATCHSSSGDDHAYRLDSEQSQQLIRQRLQDLVRRFSERALRVRRRFDFPPTPSTISSCEHEESNSVLKSPLKRIRFVSQEWGSKFSMCESIRHKVKNFSFVFEPQSYFYVSWLCIIMASYLYNCWVIPLLTFFPYRTPTNEMVWFYIDCVVDFFYLLDFVLIKPRVMYLEDGFWVRNTKSLRDKYTRSLTFKIDALSLLPADLICYYFGIVHPILRLPRLLKIQSFWEFFDYFDHALANPYAVRVTRSLTYMIFLVHLNACAYYFVSVTEGIGSNRWVFNGEGNAYIRCFYFATKTATSIGKNPRPENEMEYVFMTACWLMGVFVFALLIGQIRDIIATATKSQTEYRKYLDEAMEHLRLLNISKELMERVKMWFTYTWEQQHTLNELTILDNLPYKMKTDVAINVHINTLNKVQLFKHCDDALLRDLVLKLRPVVYLPGDYICRKGEVGKEMYIVKNGQVQVVAGPKGEEVLATLTEGTVFGEISLLSLDGGNRRTADVRSNGFSNLFVLSKDDLNEALQFYPNAQEILKNKAKQLMRQNAARERKNKRNEMNNVEPANKMPKMIPDTARILSKYSKCRYPRNQNPSRPRVRTSVYCTKPFSQEVEDQRLLARSFSVELGDLQVYQSCLDASEPDMTGDVPCQVTVHRNNE